ncbi:MAG: hypothetical protein FWE74_03200 [Oscillospiraceae bacterium]|nr:hypothetical protein [Oscillospiraceae bacterium]
MRRFLLPVLIAVFYAGCAAADDAGIRDGEVQIPIVGMSRDWLFTDGSEMGLEDLRRVSGEIPDLLISDLFPYKGMNVSSSTETFNVIISVESAGSLQVYAGSDYVITSMTFKTVSQTVPLNLLTEAQRLDEYIDGEYTP